VRKLLVLAVVAAALVAADVAARGWAESSLAEQAAAYYPPSTAAQASIRSFPFLGRLLVRGEVPEVSLSMENLRPEVVVLRHLDLDLEAVEIDRSELFRGRVRLLDVGRGTVSARIDLPSLAQAAGADVRFTEGRLEIHKRVRGVDVFATVQASIEGNTVRLQPTSVEGLRLPLETFAVTYQIPGSELFPCSADLRAVENGLLVSCRVDDVPAALVQAAAG
jgi:hypothetical protein